MGWYLLGCIVAFVVAFLVLLWADGTYQCAHEPPSPEAGLVFGGMSTVCAACGTPEFMTPFEQCEACGQVFCPECVHWVVPI